MMLGRSEEFSMNLRHGDFDTNISTILGRDDDFDRGFSEMYRRRVFDSVSSWRTVKHCRLSRLKLVAVNAIKKDLGLK